MAFERRAASGEVSGGLPVPIATIIVRQLALGR